MAKKYTRYTPMPRRFNYSKVRESSKTTVTMGKKFRTKAGRYGCYVYINGRRSHFEAANEYRKNRFEARPAKHWSRRK